MSMIAYDKFYRSQVLDIWLAGIYRPISLSRRIIGESIGKR